MANYTTGSTREEAFAELLKPITWLGRTPVEWRKELVRERYREMATVYPFLTDDEKRQADEWLAVNKHEGLWD